MIDKRLINCNIPFRVLDAARNWNNSLTENTFLYCITQQRNKNGVITTTTTDLLRWMMYDSSDKANRSHVIDALDLLCTPSIRVGNGNYISVLNDITVKNGRINGNLSADMLTALSIRGYVRTPPIRQIALKHFYSKRIYAIALAWVDYGDTPQFTGIQLRSMLSVPDSMRDSDFRRRVLTPSVNEVNSNRYLGLKVYTDFDGDSYYIIIEDDSYSDSYSELETFRNRMLLSNFGGVN